MVIYIAAEVQGYLAAVPVCVVSVSVEHGDSILGQRYVKMIRYERKREDKKRGRAFTACPRWS